MRRALAVLSGLLLVAAIALMVVAGESVALEATAVALFGVAGVLAVTLLFLAVGVSEDEERREAGSVRDERPRAEGPRRVPPASSAAEAEPRGEEGRDARRADVDAPRRAGEAARRARARPPRRRGH
jgi:hypothetical protein